MAHVRWSQVKSPPPGGADTGSPPEATLSERKMQLDFKDPSESNRAFSSQLPGMQLAIDSTSLGLVKECPRKYFLTMVQQWAPRGDSPHLQFGILLHQARELYEKLRAAAPDTGHEELLEKVLDWGLKVTWNQVLGRPWISEHPLKNRLTFIQTLVWYLDSKTQADPLQTVVRSNGQPMVELSFRFDSHYQTSQGEGLLLCGHLDRIARLNDSFYVADIKTASHVPDAKWLAQFSPHNQFSLYSIAGDVAFGFQIEGVIVDGVQVGATFARFQRHLVPRTTEQKDEWLQDFGYYAGLMEKWALDRYWPLNEASCDKYGGCPFRRVCSRSPASRQAVLETEFVKKIWDPLQVRGEE